MQLDGLHHISAITGDARRNLDFYTRVLGLRLTAKTVNQDDPSVYHLFYGDEHARPGADLTFFEYPRAVAGRPGAGMVHTIVSRVGSEAALATTFWAQRLAAEGVPVERTERSVRFADPEGLGHELVVPTSADPPLVAAHSEIAPEHALQGFEGVRAYSAHAEASGVLLERLMGATPRAPRTRGSAASRRGSCGRSVAAAGSPSTRRRPSPAASSPAPSTTSPGAPSTRTSRDGSTRSPRPASRTRATSTATTSTRSTSASRAASSTSSPRRSRASSWTASTSPSSEGRSSSRRSSRTSAPPRRPA